MYDVIVVGAGPAGSRTAAVLASHGWRVLMLEEHESVGTPVHCTGIVGADCLARYHLPEGLVRSRIDRFQVVAPDGGVCSLPGPGSIAVLDRGGLDRLLAERAVAAGVELHTQARVHTVSPGGEVVVRYPDGLQTWTARHVVLACGAMSNLPRRSGLSQPATWYRSVQSEWHSAIAPAAEVYLGSRYSQGAFAWTVPTGPNTVKAGLMTPLRARPGYQHLLGVADQRLGLSQPLAPPRWRRMPMGLVSGTVRGRLAAVGDAAGQVKTTTGGGIYYALRCADLLAQALLDDRLGGYEAAWHQAVGRDVRSGWLARRSLEGLNDAELSRLVDLCRRDEVQHILARHWHFDFHQGVLVALATAPVLRRLAHEAGGFERLLRLTGRFLSPRPIESR